MLRMLGVLVSLALLGTRPALGSWPSARSNYANTGVSTSTVSITVPSLVETLTPCFQCSASGTPLVDSQGNFYLTIYKVNLQSSFIYSYDSSYSPRWQRELPVDVGVPVLDEISGTIYTANTAGIDTSKCLTERGSTVFAITASSGALKWNHTLTGSPLCAVTEPPIVSKSGLVLLNVENARVVALDPVGGTLVWNVTVSKSASMFTLNSALQGDTFLLASGSSLYGLNADTGNLVLRTSLNPSGSTYSGGPVVDKRGVCYLTDWSHWPSQNEANLSPGTYYVSMYAYVCIPGATGGGLGQLLWQFNSLAPFPCISKSLSLAALSADESSIYSGTGTTFLSISTATGSLQWAFNFTDSTQRNCASNFDNSVPVVGSDGTIFVGATSNCLEAQSIFALRPSSKGAEVLWKFPMTYSVVSLSVGSSSTLFYYRQSSNPILSVLGEAAHSNTSTAAPTPAPSAVPSFAGTAPTTPTARPPSTAPTVTPTPAPSAVPSRAGTAPTTAAVKAPSTAPTPAPSATPSRAPFPPKPLLAAPTVLPTAAPSAAGGAASNSRDGAGGPDSSKSSAQSAGSTAGAVIGVLAAVGLAAFFYFRFWRTTTKPPLTSQDENNHRDSIPRASLVTSSPTKSSQLGFGSVVAPRLSLSSVETAEAGYPM